MDVSFLKYSRKLVVSATWLLKCRFTLTQHGLTKDRIARDPIRTVCTPRFSYYLCVKRDISWPEEFLKASPAAFPIGQVV